VTKKISATDLKIGDLLAVDSIDGINTTVWTLNRDDTMDVEAVDSLEPGDLCVCIDPEPFFKGYVIVVTHNGILGYICDNHVTLVYGIQN